MTETRIAPGDPSLEAALRRELEGEVRFDALTRGIYSTDASHYQIEPLGVVFPRSTTDVQAVLQIARERGVPVLPRGGGTSQCGQTVGRAIVLDCSRHLTRVIDLDVEGEPWIEVEPGLVLDHLNTHLEPHGLWFPVDPSTGSRATIGGMAGNNSAGARSIRYGMMVDNVDSMEIVLPDGRRLRVGHGGDEEHGIPGELSALRSLYERDADEIRDRKPRTMRNVAGYNLDRLNPAQENVAQLLVGSEGTLAFFSRLRLRLRPLPRKRALGVCHFPDLVTALDSVQHLVDLAPSAIELVDHNVLRLAADVPDFRDAMRSFVRGTPGALLLVEFASTDPGAELGRDLQALRDRLMGSGGAGDVVFAETQEEQAAVWSVRKAGLNIVMSMAGPRKPISFIEDCAVPLEHLAEYARRVTEIFTRHGTDGTWYAHASVGCLHVRPALNLKDPEDVARVRRIAEETHEVVRAFGGTHSGEHGDGLLRSEFLETMLGARMTAAYAEVKRTFDPGGIMNPGKIVDPPRMDDRRLFRYHPEYADVRALPVLLDWSGAGGMLGATERCNNNGACRKYEPDVMCPSFRVTHDERHSTRGRANALRLALSGQLGPDALTSREMGEAMSLCISCKACKRECPAGVDMARMKLEWQQHHNARRGIGLRDRLLAAIPRLAPYGAAAAGLLNATSSLPGRGWLGLARQRPLPRWSRRAWKDGEARQNAETGGRPQVALFVDTFTRWFEPENARAALRLLEAGGWSVQAVAAPDGRRPLCCGRTYLSAGMLDEARAEARRLLEALHPIVERGTPVVGLEPSCLYTLLDEVPDLLPGPESRRVAALARTMEEFLDDAWASGRPLPFDASGAQRNLLVHGHCHQKAFGGVAAQLSLLRRIPGAEVTLIESGCCGMAGAFGYHAEHYDTSMAMAELSLLPAVRAADAATRIVADGTSCRAQITDGAGREAVHAAVVLAEALGPAEAVAP
jgi:FAD/FMN-containing dehydrogenase/Fe-S oxidoreductase